MLSKMRKCHDSNIGVATSLVLRLNDRAKYIYSSTYIYLIKLKKRINIFVLEPTPEMLMVYRLQQLKSFLNTAKLLLPFIN